MAFRYLIYSTGTTFAETIVRESATDNPGAFEASLYTDFVIPEIQPIYLWRVTGGVSVVPNTEANVSAYLEATAPPPKAEDDATVGFVTGETTTKIDKVTGVTGNLGTFSADGNLVSAGYTIPQLTGLTTYSFTGSGGTQVFENGNDITIYSTPPTGTTVAWGDITGTLSNQTDLQNALNLKLNITDFNGYTGTTATEIASKLDESVFTGYTATTQPVIDAALTGTSNLGSGTTLGGTDGRNVTFKSVSVLGGLTLSGDGDNLIISGETGGVTSVNWGDINGTLSDQTDLNNVLTGHTADIATNAAGIVSNYNLITGNTADIATNAAGIVSNYNLITGLTETVDGKLDTAVFTGYTATTQPVINAALTGATNGLSFSGRVVELGGTLSKDTVVSGLSSNLTFNTQTIKLQAPNGIDIIDTDGVGGVNIESDAGTVSIIGKTSGSTEVTKLEISESLMRITDSRATKVGLVYATDYSADFTDESLITKRYANNIAAGFRVKKAVVVATTGNTALSGLLTIDGYTLQAGDRVLVKDNTDASENGIYVATGGTWTRATDYDGTPEGEVASGDLIPVLTGATNYSTMWALVTPDPITVGTTDLEYTLFSSPHEMIPGTGIDITGNVISVDGASLAGNSITWSGDTFNVDVNSGTLQAALATKLNITDFNTYSGTTVPATYLAITDFNTFTGTTLPANYYNKTEINSYTGTTDTRLDNIEDSITGLTATKLDTSVFETYTGATAADEIFLTHSGGTELNTILATAIEWDAAEVSGSSFNWTGSTEIQVLTTGLYEVSYNLPYNIAGNSQIGVGANIILNNATVIDVTAAAGLATRNLGAASIGLPTVVLSLTAGDILNLATFRTHQAGTATSSLTGSILIKRKNTLQ